MLDALPAWKQAGALSAKAIQSYTVALWKRVRGVDYRGCLDTAAVMWKGLIGVARNAAWLLPLILFIALFVQSLNWRPLIIEGITVPDQLQKNGFTPEVAAQRLYDALEDFIDKKKKTSMRIPDIRLHGNEPNIVVPAVGLSLDTIAATARRFFHRDDRRVISGDLTVSGGKVWLRLRLNGAVFYDSKAGTSLDEVDQLFEAAAQDIIWKTTPYLIASAAYSTDADKALEMVEQITAHERSGDENISRAYNLKAVIYRDRKQYDEAMTAVEKALRFDPGLAVAHNTKGLILFDKKRYELARDEFQAAIDNDPKYTLAYINLGLDLHNFHDDNGAESAYQAALKLEPNNAKAVHYLAEALHALGRTDELAQLPALGMIPASHPVEAGVIGIGPINDAPTVESGVLPDLNALRDKVQSHTVEGRPEASD
jgi:tetratricopeptide (TPR) repeat protein